MATANIPTPKTLLGEPEEYTGKTAQDSVTVHVLGFDQITRENFRVKLQAQAALTGGRDPEGLPLGFFLNGILVGKTAFDEFGVADIALTIDWAALQKGKALTVKVKGMNAAVPIAWNVPKRNFFIEIGEGVRIELIEIPSMTFGMGETDDDKEPYKNELPRHQVKLGAFALSKYPVTQAQWQSVMGSNPSKFQGADRPVEQVSWNDCQAFCQKLSSRTGTTFRLPTEAEWECACRAGTQTIWPFGNDQGQLGQYAWFSGNSGNQTHPVGQLKPNEWGLFDMLGNVAEWCQDWFDECYYVNSPQKNPQGGLNGQGRVIRGGGYFDPQNNCRSARRNWYVPDSRVSNVGFRMAYSL